MILSLLGVRQWLVRIIPQSLVLAIGSGIGLFIAFVGLSPNGLGVIGGDTVNFVGLGGCKAEGMDPALPNYCVSGVLQNPTMWLGIFLGGIVTVLMMMYRVRGAIIIGIFLVSVVSWPRPTAVTYFPHTEAGDQLFDFFKQVVTFRPLKLIGNVVDWNAYSKGKVWYALVTFLYVDLLDTTGTLYSMAKFAGLRDPVTLDFENSTIAYCTDAFFISIGALMGTSPVTAFIESATGIADGGKTGITAMTTGFAFFISVFFAPIFASIPAWATGGALVIAGSLMLRNVREINWDYLGDAVPAFLTIIIIPLSYKYVLSLVNPYVMLMTFLSIAYGVIAGILSFLLLNGIPWLVRKASGDRIVPGNFEASEEWIIPPGGIIPPWIRAIRDRRLNALHDGTGDRSHMEMEEPKAKDEPHHHIVSVGEERPSDEKNAGVSGGVYAPGSIGTASQVSHRLA